MLLSIVINENNKKDDKNNKSLMNDKYGDHIKSI